MLKISIKAVDIRQVYDTAAIACAIRKTGVKFIRVVFVGARAHLYEILHRKKQVS